MLAKQGIVLFKIVNFEREVCAPSLLVGVENQVAKTNKQVCSFFFFNLKSKANQ